MTVFDRKQVDAIGVERITGKVVLTISDHLDWSDEGGHLLCLQDKINDYLGFIESGEIERAYPDAHGRQPVINVVGKFEPTDAAKSFFEVVSGQLAEAGVEFRAKVLRD